MKVVTWNLNSVRAREARLLSWLERSQPDVMCLQELKTPNEEFPYQAVNNLGYHAAVYGQPTYNGVAILSKVEGSDTLLGWTHGEIDPQARVIASTVAGVRVVCVYVPNGKSVGTDKWHYKLGWYKRLEDYMSTVVSEFSEVVLCGDFNIALEDRDIAFPERWEGKVMCDPEGRAALRAVVDVGLVDTTRIHHEGPGPFSWWDYRMLGFAKGDGLRIDHIYASLSLANRCIESYVDRDERKGEKPSDHAPVISVFD